MSREAAHGPSTTNGTTNGNGRVSFSELVRAHHEFDAAADAEAAATVERRFRGLLEAFEASTGEIVDAYWCREAPSAWR